jgi:hypothetical protein
MTFKLINRIAFVGLLLLTLFSSCTKDESTAIIETGEEATPEVVLGFSMSVNGVMIENDVVAAYCQTDSSEFIIIANKEENLTFPLQTENFEVGDYTYFTRITADNSWGYGGQAFGPEASGLPGVEMSIIFGDSKITIESNDGEIVVGSAEGVLLGLDEDFNPTIELPYQMNFAAEIIQESDFCDING